MYTRRAARVVVYDVAGRRRRSSARATAASRGPGCTDGLPTRTGRIGLAVYAQEPATSSCGGRVGRGRIAAPTSRRQSRTGGVFRPRMRGVTGHRISPSRRARSTSARSASSPTTARASTCSARTCYVSDDGGAHVPRRRDGQSLHGDCHAMWIDPHNGKHLLLGTDGGLNESTRPRRQLGLRREPGVGRVLRRRLEHARSVLRIYGGLQDNQSWGGPSRTTFEVENFGSTISRERRHHERALVRPRWRRRLSRRGRPDRSRHRLLRVAGRGDRARQDLSSGRRARLQAVAQRRRAGVPLQLEHAVPGVAARPERAVDGRQYVFRLSSAATSGSARAPT